MKLSELGRNGKLNSIEYGAQVNTVDSVQGQYGNVDLSGFFEPVQDSYSNMTWEYVSDDFGREGSTQGITQIHRRMRRCLLLDDGTVNYYLDPNDSTISEYGSPALLDGTDGQVMVEVPKFYVRVSQLFTGEWKREISLYPRSGFVVHPAFAIGGTLQYDPSVGMWHYVGNTGERSAFYYGAYDSAMYDTSAGENIDGLNLDNNTGRVDTGEDLLTSVSGHYPMVGLTRGEFRATAENRGTGWHVADFWQWSAVKLLFFIEYGGFNSQTLLANGNMFVSAGYPASSSEQTASPHSVAGKSNSIGNGSGGVDSNLRDTAWVSYRGIENLWGNAWNWCDGWNINDRNWFVKNDGVYADNTETGYAQIGSRAPETNGYIRDVDHSTLGDVVTDVSGNSSTAFADQYFQSTGFRVARVGGHASVGVLAGVSNVFANLSSGLRYRYISARLAFKPSS